MIKADHALTQLFAKLDSQTQTAYRDLPAKMELQHFAEELFNFLFPINCRQERRAAVQYVTLADQLQRMLAPLDVEATTVTNDFFAALPALYELLLDDARATLDFDPAATSLEEVDDTLRRRLEVWLGEDRFLSAKAVSGEQCRKGGRSKPEARAPKEVPARHHEGVICRV